MTIVKAAVRVVVENVSDPAMNIASRLAQHYRTLIVDTDLKNNYSVIKENNISYSVWNHSTLPVIMMCTPSDIAALHTIRDKKADIRTFIEAFTNTLSSLPVSRLTEEEKVTFKFFKQLAANVNLVYSYCSTIQNVIEEQRDAFGTSNLNIQSVSNFNLFGVQNRHTYSDSVMLPVQNKLKYLISPAIEARIAEIVLAYEIQKV